MTGAEGGAPGPLAGRTVIITRARAQAGPLAAALEREGARVLTFPTIQVEPLADLGPLDRAITRLEVTDWVVFTSANGVERFFARLEALDRDEKSLAQVKVVAIGTATAEALRERGVRPRLVPERHQAEGVIESLSEENWPGRRVLIPRAEKGREVVPEALRQLGAKVEVVAVYRTVRPQTDPAPLREALARNAIAAITFTSSSTVTNFTRFFAAGEAARVLSQAGVVVACIGPITSATAREMGMTVGVEARSFTVDGLARALGEYFRRPVAPPL